MKVLNDVSNAEFIRLMAAITAWVSPKEGCAYCHDGADLASDAKYTKVVARRMIEMTRGINENWKSHVATTGVTCYTCHRGNPVPANIWFSEPGGNTVAGQNHPSDVVASTSLPSDPYSGFFAKDAKDFEQHPRHQHDGAPGRQPRVHQAGRIYLRPDDDHLEVARGELRLLP